MNSLEQVQYPPPSRIFLTLTEYFVSLGKYGKRHLRYQMVPSKTWYCCLVPPCTDVIISSIYQSIWARMSQVCGRTIPVLEILAMAP